MNTRKYLLNAIALCVLIGLLSSALAQTPSRTRPAAKQQDWYENGKILVEVFSPNERSGSSSETYPYAEHFGNRIMDVIPIVVQVNLISSTTSATPATQLDFRALRAGRFTTRSASQEPDWILAAPHVLGLGEKPLAVSERPTRVSIKSLAGDLVTADRWEIRLFVQTRKLPIPAFTMDIVYAVEISPNGNPDWKAATTPPFIVSYSATMDKGKDLAPGNTNLVEQRPPFVLAVILAMTGAILVIRPSIREGRRLYRRWFIRVAKYDPVEKLWLVLSPIFADAKTAHGYKFNSQQVHTIVAVFKELHNITLGIAQFSKVQHEVADGEAIFNILYWLEHKVLESGMELTDSRYAQLVREIELLCPKP